MRKEEICVDKQAIKVRIENALRRFAAVSSPSANASLVPQSLTVGKLYEAHVLSLVIEALATEEQFAVTLVNSSLLPLKSSPGPINRSYAHFELRRGSVLCAEIWTDVEFISLSCASQGRQNAVQNGDYHELDIMIADPGLTGRPLFTQVWLGVECKNTGYGKHLLKEILGVRRELSFLHDEQPTKFRRWPRTHVPAQPPSCLMVYTTDAAVTNYAAPGQVFGIDFVHENI